IARSGPYIRCQCQQEILHGKRHIQLLPRKRTEKATQAGTDPQRRNLETEGHRDGRGVRDTQGLLRAQENKGQRRGAGKTDGTFCRHGRKRRKDRQKKSRSPPVGAAGSLEQKGKRTAKASSAG